MKIMDRIRGLQNNARLDKPDMIASRLWIKFRSPMDPFMDFGLSALLCLLVLQQLILVCKAMPARKNCRMQ